MSDKEAAIELAAYHHRSAKAWDNVNRNSIGGKNEVAEKMFHQHKMWQLLAIQMSEKL